MERVSRPEYLVHFITEVCTNALNRMTRQDSSCLEYHTTQQDSKNAVCMYTGTAAGECMVPMALCVLWQLTISFLQDLVLKLKDATKTLDKYIQ